MILEIIFLVVALACCYYGIYKFSKAKKRDTVTEQENDKIREENKELKKEKEYLENLLLTLRKNQEEQALQLSKLEELTNNLNKSAFNNYEQYVNTLDAEYEMTEKEYDDLIKKLEASYVEVQTTKIAELEEIKKELDKMLKAKAAAIEAQRKEKTIKENKDKFRLNINDIQRNDVLVLNRVKKELSNPRILSMLIWQTYFRDYMTELCNNILGIKTVCGIYKITNQITDESYIGQSVDVAKRWKDHAKCGLDIDRPQGNKLYKSMIEDGIWNFTFELLEQCSQVELNEKEKFYIELYQAKEFGYNGNKGVGK